MQPKITNYKEMGRNPPTKNKGRVVMPVGETVSLVSIGKWLIGLVLAPWLWYERKRVDKLEKTISASYFTKEEVKEQIKDKTSPLQDDLKEVKETMKIMSENIVAINMTVVRIDERSKKRNE